MNYQLSVFKYHSSQRFSLSASIMYASSLLSLCTSAAVTVSIADGLSNAILSMYLHTYTAQSTLKIVQEKYYYMRLDIYAK